MIAFLWSSGEQGLKKDDLWNLAPVSQKVVSCGEILAHDHANIHPVQGRATNGYVRRYVRTFAGEECNKSTLVD